MQLNKEVTLPAISGAGSTELNVRGGVRASGFTGGY